MALKNNGGVVAWGRNDYGQANVPVAAQSGVVAIAGGYRHTVVLKKDGSVVAWGLNNYGQTTVPAGLSGVVAIATGLYNTVALKNDGSVLVWGNNDNGQTIVPVAAQSGVRAIAAGDNEIVVLKNDGAVLAWGRNDQGQANVPTGLTEVTATAAGYNHNVARLGNVVSLQVKRSGNDLILSWPVGSFGFTLQATHSLSPPVIWFDATNVPAAVGAQFAVTNPISGSARFYRLNRP